LPNPRQPRTVFPQDSLRELSESIKAQGIAQPILARMRKDHYELVAGERRLRAAKMAGISVIPAIIKEFSDEEALEISLIENLQREDLNPMDEAEAYKRLCTEFNLTQIEVAKKVGKDRSTVANMLRLLELPAEIQKSLRKEELTIGHARALLSVEDKEKQLMLFRDIIKNKLSVRDVEILIYGVPRAEAKKKGGRKKRAGTNPELNFFVEKLAERLGTKVKMFGSSERGKIEIEYYSREDLERLLELILGVKISA